MTSYKSIALFAFLLLVNLQWIQSAYIPGPGGYSGYPPVIYDNDRGMDEIFPLLLFALAGRGGFGGFGGYNGGCGCGGCGGCNNCGGCGC